MYCKFREGKVRVIGSTIDPYVAQNDISGSARVLTEMMQKAEERSSQNDVMQDQSDEIKNLLQLIHSE
ncbi:MAG: hypothetical protein GQ532_18860 [Methylomarinum sp.]|nr:hypothetical protein [Methylomarinum sp.]